MDHTAHRTVASPARPSHRHRLGLGATVVHTAGYLLVTALVAVLVFERLGLALLRTAWVNLDVIWAGASMATGGLTLAVH